MSQKKFKTIFLIGMVGVLLFVILIIGTMCGSNSLMTGSEMYRLEQMCMENVPNTIIQVQKKEEGSEEQEANPDKKEWQVITGQELKVQQLANNNLPSKYYKNLKFNLNTNFANSNKNINEIGLYIETDKDIDFKLRLKYSEKGYSEQTISLKANEPSVVMFCLYTSMQHISYLEFSNETEIKKIEDIVKWTIKDVKVSLN